jgi:hypothetical protein
MLSSRGTDQQISLLDPVSVPVTVRNSIEEENKEMREPDENAQTKKVSLEL